MNAASTESKVFFCFVLREFGPWMQQMSVERRPVTFKDNSWNNEKETFFSIIKEFSGSLQWFSQ